MGCCAPSALFTDENVRLINWYNFVKGVVLRVVFKSVRMSKKTSLSILREQHLLDGGAKVAVEKC